MIIHAKQTRVDVTKRLLSEHTAGQLLIFPLLHQSAKLVILFLASPRIRIPGFTALPYFTFNPRIDVVLEDLLDLLPLRRDQPNCTTRVALPTYFSL